MHGARHRNSAPQDNHSYCRLVKELSLSLTGYGSSLFGNRLVRTRMPGGVEGGGEKPPPIRLRYIPLVSVLSHVKGCLYFFPAAMKLGPRLNTLFLHELC